MCGIAGIFNNKRILLDPELLLSRMLSLIQYRGPDENGIYKNNNLALGSVRLSIIDIKTGQQPLSSQNGKYWIVFNGEIFNYLELKNDLRQLGFQFKTESDTEVLLNSYIAFGEDCLKKLNGQFVFAVWNNEKKELFLARDRVGIRPLFYTWSDETFVFGSEIKLLFEFPGVQAKFDPVSLSQVFTFWSCITPSSVFKDIFELPPGHYMKVSGSKATICPYWSLTFPADKEEYYSGSFEDASLQLYDLLKDSIRIRLRADVPVAAYLSGGLDSSATTALIKQVSPEMLQTFSIRFEDQEFDETPYQESVSAYLDTRHTAFTCTPDDIGRYFPEVIWHSEIPILRTAPVPMYCLSKKVRENNIKVVITGEGADEMLAGYDIFKEAIIREFWSRQPDSKYRPLLLQKLYPYLGQFQGRNGKLLKFFYSYKLNETNSPWYSHMLRWHNTANIQNFFSDDLKNRIVNADPYQELLTLLPGHFENYSRLSKSQWLEIVIFMSGYLLSSQGDRVSMANSVEGRYPFLDYRVIEFAAKLPPDYKMKGLNEKYILKHMMHGKLPAEVLKRPKQAYRAPVSGSFLSTSAKEYTLDLLSEANIKHSGIFKHDMIQKLTGKILSGLLVTEMENMALASILSTQILYHQYILKDNFRPLSIPLRNTAVFTD
jgi:asparagine synthase (glutamine-hydrolysing)